MNSEYFIEKIQKICCDRPIFHKMLMGMLGIPEHDMIVWLKYLVENDYLIELKDDSGKYISYYTNPEKYQKSELLIQLQEFIGKYPNQRADTICQYLLKSDSREDLSKVNSILYQYCMGSNAIFAYSKTENGRCWYLRQKQ
jgi:hypothetical protein